MKKLTAITIITLNILAVNNVFAKTTAPILQDSVKDSWSGFWAGVNLGYAYNEQGVNTTASNVQYCTACTGSETATLASIQGATASYGINNSSFIGGGQLGYTKTLRNIYILGLTTDLQGITNSNNSFNSRTEIDTTVNGVSQSIITNTQSSAKINYLGTLRANLGYLVKPKLLIMGTGGLAYGDVKSNVSIQQNYSIPANNVGIAPNWGIANNYSQTRVGWTAGGTAEWMLRSNFSINLNYLYYDLGNINGSNNLVDAITVPNDPQNLFINATNTKVHVTGSIVRLGFNYHFV